MATPPEGRHPRGFGAKNPEFGAEPSQFGVGTPPDFGPNPPSLGPNPQIWAQTLPVRGRTPGIRGRDPPDRGRNSPVWARTLPVWGQPPQNPSQLLGRGHPVPPAHPSPTPRPRPLLRPRRGDWAGAPRLATPLSCRRARMGKAPPPACIRNEGARPRAGRRPRGDTGLERAERGGGCRWVRGG